MRQHPQRPLAAALACAWVLISATELCKYLPLPLAATALLAGAALVAAATLWLARSLRTGRDLPALALAIPLGLLVVAFTIAYPISLRHQLGRGSDREDALRVESIALLHHHDPYAARTFLNNPPTPLPGAVLLALPFFALGHIAWQNLFWLAAFTLFTLRLFRFRITALFLLTVFLLLAPASLQDILTGGDYITNCLYVLIASALLLRSLRGPLPAMLAAATFLGIAVSSRPIYPLLLLPLLAFCLQRSPARRVVLAFAVVAAASAAVTLPVFLPHPLTGLLHQLALPVRKLIFIPASLHASIVLPALALAVCSIAFFVRMSFSRVLLLFSLGTAVLFLPPAAAALSFLPRSHSWRLLTPLEFLTVSSLCLAICALRHLEQLTAPSDPA